MSLKTRDRGMMGQYAGFFTRAAALIIDLLIILGLIFVVYWSVRLPASFFMNLDIDTCSVANTQSLVPQVGTILLGGRDASPQWLCSLIDMVFSVTAFLAAPLYFIFFYSSTGQTIGMYILGIRVVRMDGKHMSLIGSVVRWFGLFLAAIPLGAGFLWVLIDDRRQGWHDKLAHTCVIYAWRAEEDNFIVGRFKRWLAGERVQRLLGSRHVPTAPRPPGIGHLDLLTIAFPEYERLDNVLEIIQKGIADGTFYVVNATVLVKGSGDSVGVLAASDLTIGSKVNQMAEEPLMLPDYELKRLMADVPPESFVVAVVLEDHFGDALVRAVSREASAFVRRYDLDGPASPLKTPRVVGVSRKPQA